MFHVRLFNARIYINNAMGADPYEADMSMSDQGRISGRTLGEALNKAMLMAAKKRKQILATRHEATQVLEALKG